MRNNGHTSKPHSLQKFSSKVFTGIDSLPFSLQFPYFLLIAVFPSQNCIRNYPGNELHQLLLKLPGLLPEGEGECRGEGCREAECREGGKNKQFH